MIIIISLANAWLRCCSCTIRPLKFVRVTPTLPRYRCQPQRIQTLPSMDVPAPVMNAGWGSSSSSSSFAAGPAGQPSGCAPPKLDLFSVLNLGVRAGWDFTDKPRERHRHTVPMYDWKTRTPHLSLFLKASPVLGHMEPGAYPSGLNVQITCQSQEWHVAIMICMFLSTSKTINSN